MKPAKKILQVSEAKRIKHDGPIFLNIYQVLTPPAIVRKLQLEILVFFPSFNNSPTMLKHDHQSQCYV